jgi:hypothetical protein
MPYFSHYRHEDATASCYDVESYIRKKTTREATPPIQYSIDSQVLSTNNAMEGGVLLSHWFEIEENEPA